MFLPFFEGITSPDPWEFEAKCGQTIKDPNSDARTPVYDPELWFPPRDKSLYKPIADKAKSICFGKDGGPECPVRLKCLMAADERGEVHGIWGGMSHRERNALKRKAVRQKTTLEELAKKSSRHS